ncbi:Abnormal spindle-like microcephaly-associated protein, ASH domain [Phytophthora cactorum]|nr:Abnormal spindle-like microcephaly-associated protein, ASH domain [Phytophthora cactorum]
MPKRSEILTAFSTAKAHAAKHATSQIIELVNAEDHTTRVSSTVPLHQPLFEVIPAEVWIDEYTPFEPLSLKLRFRNCDTVVRRLKIEPPRSPIFRVRPWEAGNKDKTSKPDRVDGKVAAGMEIAFVLEAGTFLAACSSTGAFCSTGLADELEIGICPVKMPTTRVLTVRNVGTRGSSFAFQTSEHFRVTPPSATLAQGAAVQLELSLVPPNLDSGEGELEVKDDSGQTAVVQLAGRVVNVDVFLSQPLVEPNATYLSLSSRKTVKICNESEFTLEFSWKSFADCIQEEGERSNLLEELSRMETAEHEQLQLQLQDVETTSTWDLHSRLLTCERRWRPSTDIYARQLWTIQCSSWTLFFHNTTEWAGLGAFRGGRCCVLHARGSALLRGQGIGPKAKVVYNELLDFGDVFIDDERTRDFTIQNKGEIPAEFELIPLTMPPAGEAFYHIRFGMQGSDEQLAARFKANVIPPVFHFEVDQVDFGAVSYSFPQTRTVKLINASKIAMKYSLRVPEEASYKQKEMELIPSEGKLDAYGEQQITIRFTSHNVKVYQYQLVVGVPGVGADLLSIPVRAQCFVPEITVLQHELDFGRCFLRYPHKQMLVLENKSTHLFGRFDISEQDEHSRAIATYSANKLGNCSCLVDHERTLRMTNGSLIPAAYKTFIRGARSKFQIDQKEGVLMAGESLDFVLVANLDDTVVFKDQLHILITEGDNLVVPLSIRGTGTTMWSPSELRVVDFSHQMTSKEPRTSKMSRTGQDNQSTAKSSKMSSNNRSGNNGATDGRDEVIPVFSVFPGTIELKPRTACIFVFKGLSSTTGLIQEELVCETRVGKEKVNRIAFVTAIRANFVDPKLTPSSSLLSFEYIHHPGNQIATQSQPLSLTNACELPLSFTLRTQTPFALDCWEAVLQPGEKVDLNVEFYPDLRMTTLVGMNVTNISKVDTSFRWIFIEDEKEALSTATAKKPYIPINQVFDILPIRGTLKPNESEKIDFVYYGHANRKFRSTVACEVEGGPEYELTLLGEASSLVYKLDKQSLDFGQVLYNKTEDRDFSMNVDLAYQRQDSPNEKQRILVRLRPGIPEYFEETVVLEIAHFQPIPFKLFGTGTFAAVSLNLPRENHPTSVVRGEAPKWKELKKRAKQNSKSTLSTTHRGNEKVSSAVSVPASPQAKTTSQRVGAPGSPSRGTAAPAVDELDIEIEACRLFFADYLLVQEVKKTDARALKSLEPSNSNPTEDAGTTKATAKPSRPPSSTSDAKAHKKRGTEVFPFILSQFVLDFGNVVVGTHKIKRFSVTNIGHGPASFQLDKNLATSRGFQIEPERVVRLPEKQSVEFSVTFHARKNIEMGLHVAQLPIVIKNGPPCIAMVRALVTVPDISIFTESLDFGKIAVSTCHTMFTQLQNVSAVPAEWAFKKPMGSTKDVGNFRFSPQSGVLSPRAKANIQIEFVPDSGLFSLDFDSAYQQDEEMLRSLSAFNSEDTLQLPVRVPGQSIAEYLTDNGLVSINAPDVAQTLDDSSQPSELNNTTESSSQLPEIEDIGEPTDSTIEIRAEFNPTPRKGLDYIVIGPPRCGKSTQARLLAEKESLAIWTIDGAIKSICAAKGSLATATRKALGIDKDESEIVPSETPESVEEIPREEESTLLEGVCNSEDHCTGFDEDSYESMSTLLENQTSCTPESIGFVTPSPSRDKVEELTHLLSAEVVKPQSCVEYTQALEAMKRQLALFIVRDGMEPDSSSQAPQAASDGNDANADAVLAQVKDRMTPDNFILDVPIVDAGPPLLVHGVIFSAIEKLIRELESSHLPIPTAAKFQLVRRPPERFPRKRVARFSLRSPTILSSSPSEASSEKNLRPSGSRSQLPSKHSSRPQTAGKNPSHVQATEAVNVLVQFASSDVGNFDCSLGFEIVGIRREFTLFGRGVCGVPTINSDPRNVFMHRVKSRPEGGFVQKKFVISRNQFEFGPLIIANQQAKAPQTEREFIEWQKASPNNVEVFRMSNTSKFPIQLEFGMEKQGDDTFVVFPPALEIKEGDTREVKVWANPSENGLHENALICCISDNPEPVEFKISCFGCIPELKLRGPWEQPAAASTSEREDHYQAAAPDDPPAIPSQASLDAVNTVAGDGNLDFGLVRVGEKHSRAFNIRNRGKYSIKYIIGIRSAATRECFTIEPSEMVLEPGQSSSVNVTFTSKSEVTLRDCKDIKCTIIEMLSGKCVRDLVIEISGRNAEDAAETNMLLYELIGESCYPGINTTDYESIFEEQTVIRSLGVDSATRMSSLRTSSLSSSIQAVTFAEKEKMFSFGPLIAAANWKGTVERFKISNPMKVSSTVQFSIASSSSVDDSPPQSSAVDKLLEFEMRGEGTMPCVTVTEPTVRDSTATVLFSIQANPNFLFALGNGSVVVAPKATEALTLQFRPQKVHDEPTVSQLKITVQNNPFEETTFKLFGSGYREDLVLEDLPRGYDDELHFDDIRLPDANETQDEALSSSGAALLLKDTKVFSLCNQSSDIVRFEWPKADPFHFSPGIGHLMPKAHKLIRATFEPGDGDKAAVYRTIVSLCSLNGSRTKSTRQVRAMEAGGMNLFKRYLLTGKRELGVYQSKQSWSLNISNRVSIDFRVEVRGGSLRPACHFDVERSDYAQWRAPNVPGPHGELGPLDPSIKVIEMESLGVRVRNTRRFYVVNPTNVSYEFSWIPQADVNPCFRCATPKGLMLAGKRCEMIFEFTPQQLELQEMFWYFKITHFQVSQLFLFVGTTTEPRVALDRGSVNFNTLMIGTKTSQSISLVNQEHIPFNFVFDKTSLDFAREVPALVVHPLSGVIPPNSRTAIEIEFIPTEEKSYNFNLNCIIKRKPTRLSLNVKGEGYSIHDALTLTSDDQNESWPLIPGPGNVLDFGAVRVNEEAQRFVVIHNSGKFNFDFNWTVTKQTAAFSIEPVQGTIKKNDKTTCRLSFAPTKQTSLDGMQVTCSVAGSHSYTLALHGNAVPPMLQFSFTSHDFGPCFIAENDSVPMAETVTLTVFNMDAESGIDLDCLFEKKPHLRVDCPPTVLGPRETVNIPIVFTARHEIAYLEVIPFTINGSSTVNVSIRGEGVFPKVELVNSSMQMVVLGNLQIGQQISRTVKIANRSKRKTVVEYVDSPQPGVASLDALGISVFPQQEISLRAKESADIEFLFAPTQRIPSFQKDVFIRMSGSTKKLLTLSGCCQGIEVILETDTLSYGPVCLGSQLVRKVRLQNRGDVPTKFQWNVREFAPDFLVSPSEGMVAPNQHKIIEVTFKPAAVNPDIRYERVTCMIEGTAPATLTLVGSCVPQATSSIQDVQFDSSVRQETHKVVVIENTTASPWNLFPVVQGDHWSCPENVLVPAHGKANLDVLYSPLTMTKQNSQEEFDEQRPAVHNGSIFLAIPDGSALLYNLFGKASAPLPTAAISLSAAAKKTLSISIPIKNWLKTPQPFAVQIQKPPGKESVVFFCYTEGTVHLSVRLVNQESGEYIVQDVNVSISKAVDVDTLYFEAPVRQSVKKMVAIENPFDSQRPINFVDKVHWWKCSSPAIRVRQLSEISGRSEGHYEIEYRPTLHSETPSEDRLTISFVELVAAAELSCSVQDPTSFSVPATCKVEGSSSWEGKPESVLVKFEPEAIGEFRDTLTLFSDTIGEYKSTLQGLSVPPLPQGPITVKVDATASSATNEKTAQGGASETGKLFVSCPQLKELPPWVYYLEARTT